MNRNQKIGIGCGVLGCLGLIVVVICVAAFVFWRSQQRGSESREERASRNFNFNSSSNSNANSSSNDNSNSSNSSDDQSSSYSDDDKHKLFQAASMTGDADLTQKVYKRIGLFRADGVPEEGYQDFIREHANWALANRDFIISVSTPEKARAYVDAHLE